MKQNIFFVHCAGTQEANQGSQQLIHYLQDELGAEYNLLSPIMPKPDAPQYTLWRNQLKQELCQLTDEVILMGHSLGGAVLLKYLTEEVPHLAISGLFLIAMPYWGLDNEWQNSDYTLADNFVTKLSEQTPIFLYHSRHDGLVSMTHLEAYAGQLKQATVRMLEGNEHFFITGLPELVHDVRSL